MARHPKVIGVTGPDSVDEVLAMVEGVLPRPHDPWDDLVPAAGVRLTPKHYAYLKISEGCNHHCTFCVIPHLRGSLNSRSMDSIIREAMNLKAAGVKELLVISQDTAAYGVDKRYKLDFACGRPVHTKLIDLCRELGRLDLWTRLHYVYPYPHVDDIVPLMAEGLILPYLDVPFQHAHPRILKLMKRPACGEKNLERIAAWRRACPDITIRSTFIVGFPGETEAEFEYLLDFLREAELDRVGCFAYSPSSRSGRSFSIMSSTACPALTIIKTLRGFSRLSTSSSRLWQPMMFLPAALPFTNLSTFSVVRLKTATVNPLDSMFMTRFSPMTARPIKPISAFFISAPSRFPCKYPRPAFHPQVRHSR